MKIANYFYLDFNNTHCLMNPEVKLLLETYIQRRIEESGSIPFTQPTVYQSQDCGNSKI